MFPLSSKNAQVAKDIVEKLKIEREKRSNKLPVISFKYLYNILNQDEKLFIKNLLNQNPRTYGFGGPFLGIKRIPLFLKKIRGQKYTWEKKGKEIAQQYLPLRIWLAYKKLNKAMKNEIGKEVLVESGYRSPAYQVFTFLYYLVEKFKFDYKKTMALVALPGYSQHGYPPLQAIDFTIKDGALRDDKIGFEDTNEYEWLSKNADKYHFYLSYPENNTLGIRFEPWHWHYQKQN